MEHRAELDHRAELTEYLRSRRARLQPGDVGLRALGNRRRVPGLRREELAQLAGVSVDYYVRLEQGRVQNVSAEVLDAVARGLQLDEAERAHLFNLARPAPRRRRTPPRPQRVRPGLRQVLDSLDSSPAFVLGRRMDVLAWNRLAATLIADFDALAPEQRNMCRLLFLDPDARQRFPDWEEVARGDVAILRMYAGRHPEDPQLAALVGELSVKSDEFRRWWAEHNVREKTHGGKRLRHPLVGELTVGYETLRLPDDLDQALIVFTVEPGSASEQAMAMLASWTAGEARRAESAGPEAADPEPRSASEPG